MPTFTQDVTIYDYEVEIELDSDEVAEAFRDHRETTDLLDSIHATDPQTLHDWIRDNVERWEDLSIGSPRLTDEQKATLDRAASILDALQTLLGQGDASQIAMHLRSIARPTT